MRLYQLLDELVGLFASWSASVADWNPEALYLRELEALLFVFLLWLCDKGTLNEEDLIEGYRSQLLVREYEGVDDIVL